MIFFILNMIRYANAACDSLIKSICYHEAKRGRWDFRIMGRVREACGFVIRHHFAHCHTARGSVCAPCLVWSPSSLPPTPRRHSDPLPKWLHNSQSSAVWAAHQVHTWAYSRRPPSTSTFGLGAQCETAATQARLSQLMQKKEKSFGKVTIYHTCTLPALGTLGSSKASLLFRCFCVFLKDPKYYCRNCFERLLLKPINLARCNKYCYILCKSSLCGCKDTTTKGWSITPQGILC